MVSLKNRYIVILLTAVFTCSFLFPFISRTEPAKASSISINLNGRELACDVPPVTSNNRVLVPLRAIYEAVNVQVAWNGYDQSITASQGTKVIILHLGESQATINGITIILDQPPIAVEGRTMVPLRFVTESLGGHSSYDQQTQEVTIIERVRDFDADIYDGNPPMEQEFNDGAYEGERDLNNNPSGEGVWIDKEGNTYNGEFNVNENELTISDAVIDFPGYQYSNDESTQGNNNDNEPDPGGWVFEGDYTQNMDTQQEIFVGTDKYGDGSKFYGEYHYNNDDLSESGTLMVANGEVIDCQVHEDYNSNEVIPEEQNPQDVQAIQDETNPSTSETSEASGELYGPWTVSRHCSSCEPDNLACPDYEYGITSIVMLDSNNGQMQYTNGGTIDFVLNGNTIIMDNQLGGEDGSRDSHTELTITEDSEGNTIIKGTCDETITMVDSEGTLTWKVQWQELYTRGMYVESQQSGERSHHL